MNPKGRQSRSFLQIVFGRCTDIDDPAAPLPSHLGYDRLTEHERGVENYVLRQPPLFKGQITNRDDKWRQHERPRKPVFERSPGRYPWCHRLRKQFFLPRIGIFLFAVLPQVTRARGKRSHPCPLTWIQICWFIFLYIHRPQGKALKNFVTGRIRTRPSKTSSFPSRVS
jgi:hypothetical protein